MVKPKKALKGLFSRTEPADEAPAEPTVSMSMMHEPAPAPVPTFAPVPTPAFEELAQVAAEPVAVVPEPAMVEPAAVQKVEAVETKPQPVVEEEEAPAMVAPVSMMEAEATHAEPLRAEPLRAEPPQAQPLQAETAVQQVVEAISELHPVVVETKASPVQMAQVAQAAASSEDGLLKIQYNFDRLRDERSKWAEGEYLAFIRRLDAAQTEAFLLKGKLLDEVKRRFFEDSKTGWKNFCEDSLSMNYTTANQYIRVAQEFDVTSHHRPDFGFEHFKALLPLAAPQRTEILEALPEVSVKTLRRIVQEKLQLPAPKPVDAKSDAKNIVKILQNLKMQIFDCSIDTLTQTQRWQLSAACQNLSNELAGLADALNKPMRRAGAGHNMNLESGNASARAGGNDVTSHQGAAASHRGGAASLNEKIDDTF